MKSDKGLSRLCFNEAVQKALKALENCTLESLTPYQSKALYSVLKGFVWNNFNRVWCDLCYNLHAHAQLEMLRLVADVCLGEVTRHN